MALAAVRPAMTLEESKSKSLHPFFVKPQSTQAPERGSTTIGTTVRDENDDPDFEDPDSGAQKGKGRKKRSRKSDEPKQKKAVSTKKGQTQLDGFTKHTNALAADTSTGEALHREVESHEAPNLDEDPNEGRRKRRRTASPTPVVISSDAVEPSEGKVAMDWHEQLAIEAVKAAPEVRPSSSPKTPVAAEKESANLHKNILTDKDNIPPVDRPNDTLQDAPEKITPKTKTIKVSKNGKLLSSPPAKSGPVTTASPRKKRGRPPKQKPVLTVTVIKYGSDVEHRRILGQKIHDILEGRKQAAVLPLTPKKAAPKPTGPPKATHPFFLGKPAPPKDEPAASIAVANKPAPRTPRKSVVTPGKLRAESRSHHSPRPFPAFGPIAGDSTIAKYPGMTEAPWPTKETAHVRDLSQHYSGEYCPPGPDCVRRNKKLKSNVVHIPETENLLVICAQEVNATLLDHRRASNNHDRYFEAFRAPSRLLTTGAEIRDRVRKEVKAPLGFQEGQDMNQLGVHPVLESLYKDIEETLTPFDRGVCEKQSWVQKYAPSSASHVLQRGKDANVLRDWLLGLTVMSVNSGQSRSKPTSASDAKKPAKKRRKKTEDDFIVSDGDDSEDEEMVKVSEGEEHGYGTALDGQQKSLKRPKACRNKNVVVVSGPPGCGKSATVYAVAKELGFEVFEINSGSRRSGKDIQDKVGDMTANHLVNHKRDKSTIEQKPIAVDDTDSEKMSEAFNKDLASGRQGTMTSFFKSKPQAKSKPAVKLEAQPKESTTRPTKEAPKSQATLPGAQARQSQKQSLILFEEADVLFEEDQQFWSQVTKLASQSKRPIVITCNDERRIPTYDLPLGAILRLGPPAVDLATDYLLLVAAKEGHILQRKAVSDLYQSKGCDLRASIAELNLWCQMSVGDRKGGLEWIYQRWPPGKDVDKSGRTLRVASEGTYQSGMGFLSYDVANGQHGVAFDREEELLKEAWREWGLSPSGQDRDLQQSATSAPAAHLSTLEDLERMADAASAADIYCRIGLPTYEHHIQEPTDPSLPRMSDKERLNYIEGAPLLQVDHHSDFSCFDTSLAIQSQLAIKRVFGRNQVAEAAQLPPSRGTDLAEDIIQHVGDAHKKHSLSWVDFSEAFDILASPPAATLALSTPYQLTASSFDRTFRIVVEDLASYVRSIVAHELRLDAQRVRLSSLLSEGGTGKRGRSTRASRVALEGGRRETKRREHWFDKDLNRVLVMNTAGKGWSGLGARGDETEASSRTEESLPGTQVELTSSQ
ncbi:hypothetical protein BDV96DRAFT_582182 [Lophiotrema nucula]|uniref:AAA+ ATPase domain-containing protein n=1 Tax=Lophiotrema nucula TaxID=690887 RepID=A0A6A5YX00_9PLEO|nr:hypothetical protein BDV96DRAFT_582182 [Lophiotrema nucula]